MATTFTNRATLNYNGGSVESNVAVGAVEGSLSVGKNAAEQDYRAGDTVTYVISIINNSNAEVSGLTVTDDLGSYLFNTGLVRSLRYVENSVQYYRGGELQPAPAVSADSDLIFSNISVPAQSDTLLIYKAEISEFAPLEAGSTVENTVVVTGDSVCSTTASANIPAATEAALAMLKSVTPVPVAENGELTYIFQLQNTGNTAVTPEDNAFVSDTFLPILRNIKVTLNGKPLSADQDYTYDEDTGVFRTADGVIAIPAAVFTQDADTGAWSTEPGTATLTVTGAVGMACEITGP